MALASAEREIFSSLSTFDFIPTPHTAAKHALFYFFDPQRTKMDLVKTGESVDTEKDFCLERFMAFAKKVTDKLVAKGLWADYIDPCSGLAMAGNQRNQYFPTKRRELS